MADPDFSGSGTVIDNSSVQFQVGALGNGDYQLKYIVQDLAKNTSSIHTANFTIDSNAPLLTVDPPQYSYLSVNGNTLTSVQWQCSKRGEYQLKLGSLCSTGTDLTTGANLSGTYSTENAIITSTIDVNDLNAGENVVKICFDGENNISSDSSLSLTRDDLIPTVSSTSPSDGSGSIKPDSTITITLNKGVDPSTVTTSSDSTCSGSLQVSSDDFVTCVPISGDPVYNASNSVFTITPEILTGLTNYKIRATSSITDLAGNTLSAYTSPNGFMTINDPGIVSVTSPDSNGTYCPGSTIAIEVLFSCVVNVMGTPTLSLNSGGTADYQSGSGTDTLTFTYVAGDGEFAPDLDYSSISALSPNGSIVNSIGVEANPTLPEPNSKYSLGGSRDMLLPGMITPSGVTATDSEYDMITVSWNEVTGAAGYDIYRSINDESNYSLLDSVSGGATTLYDDTSVDGDTIYYYRIVAFNSSDYESCVSASDPGLKKLITVLYVTSSNLNGFYSVGYTIPIQVRFSEAVNVSGTPTLSLNSGGTASYDSGSGSDTLTFLYTSSAGETTTDLDYSSENALSTGTYIRNSLNFDAVLDLPSPGDAGSLGANKNLRSICYGGPITGISASDNVYNFEVHVNWTFAGDSNGLYRTDDGSFYRHIGTRTWGSWCDTSAVTSEVYTYRVTQTLGGVEGCLSDAYDTGIRSP
ncbi:Ig-like domain-containing protein [Spirochaetota bacterium]